MHALLIPFILFSHVGTWLDNTVFSPFEIGTTAKQILEEQLGVYGVLSYLIYKVLRLGFDYFPLFRPGWLIGNALRATVLYAAAFVASYLVTAIYVGTLIAPLQLIVSIGGMIAASVLAWLALGYHYTREAVERAREAAEAAEQE